jgi:hypothetical protein
LADWVTVEAKEDWSRERIDMVKLLSEGIIRSWWVRLFYLVFIIPENKGNDCDLRTEEEKVPPRSPSAQAEYGASKRNSLTIDTDGCILFLK